MKKIISVLLALALLVTSVVVTSAAVTTVDSGNCGDNVTWTLTSDGTLTISGEGAMEDYKYGNDVPWYSIRDAIKTVVIESGVTSIGEYSFYYCLSLTSFSIPRSVTSIGYAAFENCWALESITIPKGVTSISYGSFCGCRALKSITVDEGNPKYASLGNCLFNKSTKTLIRGCATSVVPDDGSVTSIDGGAFDGCTSLTSIIIPAGVTSIGASAFANCSSLTSIAIPSGVTSIGASAFFNCSSLTSIQIPEGVTSIGDGAFLDCSSLTSIHIPASVVSIGEQACMDCSALTSITVAEENSKYASSGNCLIDKTAKTLLRGCNTSVIPNDGSVISIGESAFCGCSTLASITIPASVTSIGNGAFEGCSSLASITVSENNPNYSAKGNCLIDTTTKTLIRGCGTSVIPDDGSVTSIDWSAFTNCASLISITIPASITSIDARAFEGCTALTSITVAEENPKYFSSGNCLIEKATKTLVQGCNTSIIPDDGSVTSVGDCAFSGYSSLTSITIPENVTSVGDYAFYDCSSLSSVTLSSTLISIGREAFYACTSLKQINIPEKVTSIGMYSFCGCTSLEKVIIPEGVTAIGWGVFSGCTSLTSVTIPKGVTSIGVFAFYNCTSLTKAYYLGAEEDWDKITLEPNNSALTDHLTYAFTTLASGTCGDNVTWTLTSDGTLTISGEGAMKDYTLANYVPWFNNRTIIKTVVIESGVTAIGNHSFNGCTSLTSVTIPEGVKFIGEYSFGGCTSLTSITIPEGVTLIGRTAFSDCSALTSITIPTSLPYIGEFVFCNCTSLASITIPANIFSIGTGAFAGCTSLAKAYYLGTATDWGKVTVGENNFALTDHLIYHAKHEWGVGVITKVPTYSTEGEKTYTCECGATKTEVIEPLEPIEISFTSDLDPDTLKTNDFITFTLTPAASSLVAVGKLYFSASSNLEYVSATEDGQETTLSDVEYGTYQGKKCYFFFNGSDTQLPTVTLKYKYTGNSCGDVSLTVEADDFINEAEIPLPLFINTSTDKATLKDTIHYYASYEKYNETHHKHICSCGAFKCEEHNWGNGVTTQKETATANGIRTYTCKDCGETKTEIIDTKLTLKDSVTGITIEKVQNKTYLRGLTSNTTVDELCALFSNDNSVVWNRKGEGMKSTALVGTGCSIKAISEENEIVSDFIIIVDGDTDGDGQISSADALYTIRASAGLELLEDVFEMAADIDNNRKLTSVDALRILRKSVGLPTPWKK